MHLICRGQALNKSFTVIEAMRDRQYLRANSPTVTAVLSARVQMR